MSDEMVTIVDFSDDISEAEAPLPLPVGPYDAQINGAHVRVSSTKGTKYGEIAFFISPDQYPADYPAENAPDGTTLYFRRVSLEDTAQARFGLRRFCEAVGAPMSKRIDMSEWVGLTASVSVEHEEFEGITRAVITRVNQNV